jgi:hypothetical protein
MATTAGIGPPIGSSMTQSSTFYKHLEWPKSKVRPEHFSLWSLCLCVSLFFSFSEKTRKWVKSVSNQTAGSLREIHYLCALAPLRLCVLFFQAAGSLREIHYLCVDFFYLFLVGLFKELLL